MKDPDEPEAVEPELSAEAEESLALEPVFKDAKTPLIPLEPVFKEADEAPLEPEEASQGVAVTVVVVTV